MLGDRFRAGVIARKRQLLAAETVEQHEQVTGRTIEVLRNIVRVHPQTCGGRRHKLAKTDCAHMATCVRIIAAFDFYVGPEE